MTPKSKPTQAQEEVLAALAARVLLLRLSAAQALRDGRRPTGGALNDTQPMHAEQEDAYRN